MTNEESLWAGDGSGLQTPDALEALPEVRSLLAFETNPGQRLELWPRS